MLMENTKCIKNDCSNPLNSKFYAVIIQYTCKLQTMQLFKFVRSLIADSSRNNYHFRKCKQEDLVNLTLSEYNGVCPIGNKVDIPIILDSQLLSVPTGYIWLGGGEPDLKLCLNVSEFVKNTCALVGEISKKKTTNKTNLDDDDENFNLKNKASFF